jgi:hypothetical protein
VRCQRRRHASVTERATTGWRNREVRVESGQWRGEADETGSVNDETDAVNENESTGKAKS